MNLKKLVLIYIYTNLYIYKELIYIYTKKEATVYLLAEEAVHQEDEDALQAVDDGEEVGHDAGSRSHLQDSQKPRASQDEELSCGFKCQHPE